MKKCPFCAEEIQDDAIKCRFCGEYLDKTKKYKGCLIGCLVVLVVSIISVMVLSYFGSLAVRLIVNRPFIGPREFRYFPPFMGFGFGEFLKDFLEGLRGMLEKLKEFAPQRVPKYI